MGNVAPSKSDKPAQPRSRRLAYGFIALGILLAIAAIAVKVRDRSSRPAMPPEAAHQALTSGEPAPSSQKPNQKAVDTYKVAPNVPKYITIPEIGVAKTRVVQLGLLKNNQIATPNNIYDAGWYSGSSQPGQPGAMFIYGHVSSWQADGAFYNLKKLTIGDRLSVTRGDDKVFTYQVTATKTYPYDKVDMQQVLAPADGAKNGLNLMTCTGKVIKGTSEFNQRLVVFTKQI